jgi:hypothetical protein
MSKALAIVSTPTVDAFMIHVARLAGDAERLIRTDLAFNILTSELAE